MTKPLKIADREFSSRLFLGTGKFASNELMASSLEASGTEIVTVALRRANLTQQKDDQANILEYVDPEKYLVLPNTSEIHPDPTYLLPDPIETLKAAEILVKEGFVVMPYINADPVLAKRLEEVGTATVMPLGAPIGTNLGISTRDQIKIIVEQANIPVVCDAGIGAPSHAAEAMELGVDAVLVNTAIAIAQNPVKMAQAFEKSVVAGRMAYESGLGGVSYEAVATSPLTGFLTT